MRSISTVLPEAQDALHRAVQASSVEFTLRGHADVVRRAVFSPDGMRIATASADGTAKIWDAANGKELLTLQASSEGWVDSVAFSRDGTLLATAGDDKTVRIWESVTGRQLLNLKGHSDWVSDVAFSPDGSMLASSSADGTIKVWDVRTGKEVNNPSRRGWRPNRFHGIQSRWVADRRCCQSKFRFA